MLAKTTNAIADGLYRQMPVKGSHHGRGSQHSDTTCFHTCLDSWQRCVNEMAHVLFGIGLSVNPRAQAFIERCKGKS